MVNKHPCSAYFTLYLKQKIQQYTEKDGLKLGHAKSSLSKKLPKSV